MRYADIWQEELVNHVWTLRLIALSVYPTGLSAFVHGMISEGQWHRCLHHLRHQTFVSQEGSY
jgi:hypothetical protein